MAASDLVDLSGLIDDAKCFALVRQRRWSKGVRWACRKVFQTSVRAA